jgi:hypothetical protein
MKIEAGKYDMTRDGRKVGPMRSVNWHLYPFDISGHESEDLGGCLWDRDGNADDDKHMDIIAEWGEPMTPTPDPLLTDRARALNALMALLRDANTAALDLSAYDASRAIIDAMAKTVPHYMGANDE